MHPTEELLLAVASGQADLPHRVLVEGHLDTCAACRATLAEITAPGGVLLVSLPEAPVPDHLWQNLQRSIAVAEPAGPSLSPALASAPLPESTRRELPDAWRSREIRWHRLPARGARFATLLRDPFTGSRLYIGHMPADRFAPEHIHTGPEDLLVLAGGYEDQFGVFEAGAYATYAPGTKHHPFTEPDEECWILFRLEKPNLLTGWRGWLQRLLT